MVSKSKYNLSATEMEIMEFLWDTNKKLSASEILKYFNDNKSKNWKKTINNIYDDYYFILFHGCNGNLRIEGECG